MSISLVIPTYNWPEALELIFLSLLSQRVLPDELIIADDGSTRSTHEMIEKYRHQLKIPLVHLWQEDKGYRKSIILNKAIAKAKGDYIIQIDGDCIMHEHFISDHISASCKNTYLYGSRVNLNQELLKELFEEKKIKFPFFQPGLKRRTRNIRIPVLGKLFFRTKKLSKKIRGCNFSFWRKDFIAVNGYNEDITGWGREDSELIVRMINNSVLGKRLRYRGIVYHIHHTVRSSKKLDINYDIQQQAIQKKVIFCENGMDKYLKEI
ncbi:MAG: glycosyltransferase family 2 protein [Flavobacteriaceae bacterium]|nr:glycosyltransferase family 2 protein [Bacteroidia bacterium]MBT8287362.1 glycosyltransferase family 2 protein [Bacteroidia bacterium]NNF75015.1 glycosyltransferase family 2 protein [Flavobacteriaceae bacterium]NNK73678.1 glycosyltransferase family 2 protein [Flavobacteriaceae bacterium]